MMIDRPARDVLVQAIEDYLAERIDNDGFDDAIFSIETLDPTVKAVAGELWCLYDDCTPHLVVADKVRWDFFQRTILLLKSDRTVVLRRTKVWSPAQGYAALTVVSLALAWWIWNVNVFVLIGIAAPISWFLRAWTECHYPYLAPKQVAVYPFASVGQLRETYRAVPFRKQSYPTHLADRRIRGKTSEHFSKATSLLLAPLFLIEQAFPTASTQLAVE